MRGYEIRIKQLIWLSDEHNVGMTEIACLKLLLFYFLNVYTHPYVAIFASVRAEITRILSWLSGSFLFTVVVHKVQKSSHILIVSFDSFRPD